MVSVRRTSDLALDVAIAEALLVVAPLGVAIEELADRRVPPVDDVDAVRSASTNVARPISTSRSTAPRPRHLLAQAQVPEVGRRRIDQDRLQIGPRVSDTPCSRSICATSAGTSSRRASPISSRSATSSSS